MWRDANDSYFLILHTGDARLGLASSQHQLQARGHAFDFELAFDRRCVRMGKDAALHLAALAQTV